jgi:hypothetical protein
MFAWGNGPRNSLIAPMTPAATLATSNALPPPPGLKNNSGETQGTTPGARLPTSDGAR